MDSALKELLVTVARIKELSDLEPYSKLAKARALPATYAAEVNGLHVDTRSSYGGRISSDQQLLADRLKARMIEEERARGERERSDLLLKHAATLEALRDILPSLAARASIEIGEIARGLVKEAEKSR